MDSLLLLPAEIWREHILGCLVLKDIVKATSAFANQSIRSHFLSLADGLTFKSIDVCSERAQQILWCSTYNILPNCLFVSNEIDTQIAAALPTLCARVTKLKYLNIAQWITPSNCPRLVCLEFYLCMVTSLGSLVVCPNLTKIRLERCHNISTDSFVESVAGCDQLDTCTIRNCNQIEQQAVSYILKHFRHLVSFTFGGSILHPYDLSFILNNCTSELSSTSSVRSIILSSHCRGNSDGFKTLSKLFPRLQTLHLPIGNITDTDIGYLVQSCTQLTDLKVSTTPLLTNAALQTIALYLPLLSKLDVSHCINITDEGVKCLAKRCIQLKSLNLSDCNNVTDEAVQETWLNCKHLEGLEISGCVRVTDAAFEQPINTVLRYLNVSNTFVRGAILRYAPKLTSLDCSDCPNIKSEFVHDIASRPNTLRCLTLTRVQLSDTDLLVLSEHLPCVTYLELSNCNNVDDTVARSFVLNCPCLEVMDLSYCSAVTYDTIQELRNLYKPRLLISFYIL